MATDYTNIDEPYNTFLERSEQSTNNGNVETQPVKSDGAMSDVWIKNFIRSEGWRPKTSGFYINGQTGYAEFSNVYVSGNIQALTGSIGGFVINSQYIEDVGDSFGLSSEGTLGSSVRLWAGATFANRASAPFRVLADGTIAGSSITVSAINLPDTTTVQSFHVQNNGNSWWGANLAAGYAAAPAYILSDGSARFTQVNITGSSTLGGSGRLASTVASAINASGNLVNDALGDLINSKLNTQSQEILQDFDFGTTNYSGGIRTGSINWNSGGWVSGSGVVLCRNGIIGANGAQVTFSINSGTGAAYFAGALGSGISISAPLISGGTITGTTISIGTAPNIFKADFSGIYLGSSLYAAAPFKVSMAGEVQASDIKITRGGSVGTKGYLRWGTDSTNGSKIWEDSNMYMGMNALGGRIYFYTNSSPSLTLFDGTGISQSVFEANGVMVKGSFNVGVSGSTVTARITGPLYLHSTIGNTTLSIQGGAGNDITYKANQYHRFLIGATAVCRISTTGFWLQNTNRIDTANYYMTLGAGTSWTLNGNAKTAIVPTSKGFNALYCTESPEVWFMDFCDKKGELDPMFEEVTVAPYRYIKCEDGGYQVWGKRKGHANKRFESKTRAEFEANERFLNMNKPTSA